MAHILIIEDYRDTREVTELILRDGGHRVTSVANGVCGVEAARRQQPDLVLMDLNLPQLDGWEATRQLQSDACTSHIPIVAFTAHVTEEELAHASAAGCQAVITKPFDIDLLLGTIEALLAQQRGGGASTAGDAPTAGDPAPPSEGASGEEEAGRLRQ